MNANVYNVIWADDECHTLEKDQDIRLLFDENKIEVLNFVPTSEALKDALDIYKDKIDAVIVDANFPRTEVDYLDDVDISGLIHTISFIELVNSKRDIPFFLYTGRTMLLQEICKNGELDYFLKTERLIQKGNIETLVSRIIKDVDHIHSIEFFVKKKYKKVFDIVAEMDKKCSDNLHQFLLDEARDNSFERGIDLFNKLRDILEIVQDKCVENLIVPDKIRSLNDFKRFWQYNNKDKEWRGVQKNKITYKPNEGIMPIPIAHTLSQLIDIIQDGSHKKQDLNLQISEYVSAVQSPYLFRACLYLVMDVLRWYKDLIEKLNNEEIKIPLYNTHCEVS